MTEWVFWLECEKASSVEDTVKCLDIKLCEEDVKYMEEAVKAIQVAVLDK